jgi:hypothetical protein
MLTNTPSANSNLLSQPVLVILLLRSFAHHIIPAAAPSTHLICCQAVLRCLPTSSHPNPHCPGWLASLRSCCVLLAHLQPAKACHRGSTPHTTPNPVPISNLTYPAPPILSSAHAISQHALPGAAGHFVSGLGVVMPTLVLCVCCKAALAPVFLTRQQRPCLMLCDTESV